MSDTLFLLIIMCKQCEVGATPYVSMSGHVSVFHICVCYFKLYLTAILCPDYVRFLMAGALFGEVIYYINEKGHHYDISTIRVHDKKCHVPSHLCKEIG